VTALVSVAGFPAERFVFEGFLPTRSGPRAARLRALATEPRALVFFEAGRRLVAFLDAAVTALGEREVVMARELTKLHEELWRGTLGALRARLAAAGGAVKGEVTLLVAGAPEAAAEAIGPSLDDEIRAARAAGHPVREIAAEIAQRTGLARRAVYRRALELERAGG
jgi:16S rRNA (cytidine1402-2'-O)-methyltransferase